MSEKKKAGRPASNKSMYDRITVRLDKDCLEALNSFCKKNNCDQSTAIRKAILLLK